MYRAPLYYTLIMICALSNAASFVGTRGAVETYEIYMYMPGIDIEGGGEKGHSSLAERFGQVHYN